MFEHIQPALLPALALQGQPLLVGGAVAHGEAVEERRSEIGPRGRGEDEKRKEQKQKPHAAAILRRRVAQSNSGRALASAAAAVEAGGQPLTIFQVPSGWRQALP